MEQVKKNILWLAVIASAYIYYLFAFHFKRTDHCFLFIGFSILFALSLWLILRKNAFQKSIWILFGVGLIFRLIFTVASPHLSDDYFRFTWDGELQNKGFSAFEFLPSEYKNYFENDSVNLTNFKQLYQANSSDFTEGMNSKNYYSIYPAVNQFIFAASLKIGDKNKGNLTAMRLFILIAEIITFFLLRALLINNYLNSKWVNLYWLNPLIIIELTGNLHFEGIAICFILLSIWLLDKKKVFWASGALALAINTKLNPLFLIGAVFKNVSFKRCFIYGFMTIVLSILLLSLILDTSTILNFNKSVGLYFAWFSFNAGPFYLIKELGFLLADINLSNTLGFSFPIVSILFFLQITFFSKKSIVHKLLLLYVVYFSFSPIVHPWYITFLIPLGILSQKIYPLVWSLVVFTSYTAYGEVFRENLLLIYLEYLLVFSTMFLEYKKIICFSKLFNFHSDRS